MASDTGEPAAAAKGFVRDVPAPDVGTGPDIGARQKGFVRAQPSEGEIELARLKQEDEKPPKKWARTSALGAE